MGGSSVTTGYKYYTAMILGLCEGAINAVTRIWTGNNATLQAFANNNYGLSLIKNGGGAKSVWGYLTAKHPEQALTYTGLNYLVGANVPLGENPSSPNFTFEVQGIGIQSDGLSIWDSADVTPSFVIADLLTNPFYGAGLSLDMIGDLDTFADYCVAQGFFFSPAYTEQKAAKDMLSELVQAANAELVWDEGKLAIVPYADRQVIGNGITYTPDMTPEADLTDDDFIIASNDVTNLTPGSGPDTSIGTNTGTGFTEPITCTISNSADAYNHVQVEFADRSQDYNFNIAEAKDIVDIAINGLRTKDSVQMHFICDSTVAQTVAQIMKNRSLYVRRTFEFELSWNYCLLKPMSLVTITDETMGIDKLLCRVVSIEETGGGTSPLKFTVEESPIGTYTPMVYTPQAASGVNNNPLADPGNTAAPIVFEPPAALGGGYQVWIAAAGVAPWGGCNVWVSTDGNSYSMLGSVEMGCRKGALTATLGSHTDPDGSSTLSVDLTQSAGQLPAATQADADNLTTLCYVGGELISYANASLTSQYHYNLTYLRRGAYGTPITSHSSGAAFARLDDAVFKYGFTAAQIGMTIYIKLQSYNFWGLGQQDITTLTPYTYTILGTASGIRTQYFNSQTIPSNGKAFTYSPVFTTTPNLQVTIYNQQSGDYYTITNATGNGFTIQILNNGTGVSRMVDISATGK